MSETQERLTRKLERIPGVKVVDIRRPDKKSFWKWEAKLITPQDPEPKFWRCFESMTQCVSQTSVMELSGHEFVIQCRTRELTDAEIMTRTKRHLKKVDQWKRELSQAHEGLLDILDRHERVEKRCRDHIQDLKERISTASTEIEALDAQRACRRLYHALLEDDVNFYEPDMLRQWLEIVFNSIPDKCPEAVSEISDVLDDLPGYKNYHHLREHFDALLKALKP